ncbi:hypothetical protein PHET_07626 [Paragonimus heterotremus]|uniref:Uncharacterized protein n=1 Tax=Paragonimus heterotremus TaxID=100268 RepID=A0A8J4SXI9_9TREM|nr:hypothetical protein PHET_07626 [Paragonimus heterotremus]
MQIIRQDPVAIILRLHTVSERQNGLKIICFHGTTQESVLLTVNTTCNKTDMMCANKQCFPETQFCDGTKHCLDSSDERIVHCPVQDKSNSTIGVQIAGQVSIENKPARFVGKILTPASAENTKLLVDLCSEIDTGLRMQKGMSGVSSVCYLTKLDDVSSVAVFEVHVRKSTLDSVGINYQSRLFYDRFGISIQMSMTDVKKYMFLGKLTITNLYPIGTSFVHHPSYLVFFALVIYFKIPLF